MMTPLDSDARRSGGLSRDKNLPDWAAAFISAKAVNSRPLKFDNPATLAEIFQMLRAEGQKFPWVVFCAVGMDGTTVPHDFPRKKAEAVLRDIGGIAGFAGLLWLNKKLCMFTRALKAGPEATAQLEATADKMKNLAEEIIQKELAWRMGGVQR